MNQLIKDAKKYITDRGYGSGTNITIEATTSLLVGFYKDQKLKEQFDKSECLNSLETGSPKCVKLCRFCNGLKHGD